MCVCGGRGGGGLKERIEAHFLMSSKFSFCDAQSVTLSVDFCDVTLARPDGTRSCTNFPVTAEPIASKFSSISSMSLISPTIPLFAFVVLDLKGLIIL